MPVQRSYHDACLGIDYIGHGDNIFVGTFSGQRYVPYETYLILVTTL